MPAVAELPRSVKKLYGAFYDRYPPSHADHARVMSGLAESVVFVFNAVKHPGQEIPEPEVLIEDPYGFTSGETAGFGLTSPMVEVRKDFETQQRKTNSQTVTIDTAEELQVHLEFLPKYLTGLDKQQRNNWVQSKGEVPQIIYLEPTEQKPESKKVTYTGQVTYQDLAAAYPDMAESKIRDLLERAAVTVTRIDYRKVFERREVIPIIEQYRRRKEVTRVDIVVRDGTVYASSVAIAQVREGSLDPHQITDKVRGLPHLAGYGAANTAHLFPLRNVLIRFDEPHRERREKAGADADTLWLHTLKATTFPQALRLVRVELGLSREDFAELSGVSISLLEELELGKDEGRKPHLSSINKIITASTMSRDSKAAQLFRLRSQQIQPLTVMELAEVPFSELITYLRVSKGASQAGAAKELPFSSSLIAKAESGINKPKGMGKAFAEWLGVEPEFAAILEQRNADEPITISPAARHALLRGTVILVDGLEEPIGSVNPVCTAIENASTVPDAFRALEGSRGITDQRLHKALFERLRKRRLRQLTSGNSTILDYMTGSIMLELGFTVHDPETQAMIKKVTELQAA